MPWSFPIALMQDRGLIQQTYDTVKQQDLDLYADLGSPGQPTDVFIIFDGIDVCSLSLGAWPNGSIINIQLINNATIKGRGGFGGGGGESFFEGLAGQQIFTDGYNGGGGQFALRMATPIGLNMDADDGYIWGGGAGGGGAGGGATVAGQGGGGGGGGQGWIANSGGAGGFFGGVNGGAGGPGGPGLGGTFEADGGDGVTWGGRAENGEQGAFSGGFGGDGGAAGHAIQLPSPGFQLLSNQIATVNTSSTLTATFNLAHGASVGDRIVFLPLAGVQAYPTFNGITLNSSYEITATPLTTSIEFVDESTATGTGSGFGSVRGHFQDVSASLSFNGGKSEATLLSEGRLLGPMGGTD